MASLNNFNRGIFLIIISLLFCPFISNAQEVINTEHITISNGLSDNQIMSIIQDSYGFMWFATQNGLDRYDGQKFKVYKNEIGDDKTIIDNRLFDIAEDKDKNIWVANWGGVSMLNRYTGNFKNYNLNKFAGNFRSGTPKTVEIYCDSKNNIWAATVGGGLLRLDRKLDQFVSIPFDSSGINVNNNFFNVLKGFCEYDGKMWFISWKHGLCYYDSTKKLLKEADFKSADDSYPYINFHERGSGLFADPNGFLWILTEKGIYKFNSKDNTLNTVYTFDTKVVNNNAFFPGITQDKDGNLWIGTSSSGLLKFEGISNKFKKVNFTNNSIATTRGSLLGEGVVSLCSDKSGMMWIGTPLYGIYKYDPTREPFVNYKYNPDNKNSLSGTEIFALYQSKIHKDLIYVGTRGAGFDKFYPDQHKFERINVNFKGDMFGGSVRSILENNDGSLYLGSWGGGLYKYYPNGTFQLISRYDSSNTESLSNDLVRVIKRDRYGKLWIGTNFGLNIYDPATKKIERIYSEDSREYPEKIMNLIRSKEHSKSVLQSILKVGDNKDLTKELVIDKPGNYICVSGGEGLSTTSPINFDFGWIENQKGDTVWTSKSFSKSYYLGGATKNRITIGLVKLIPGIYKVRYKSDDSHSYGKWNAQPPADSSLWGIQVIKLDEKEDQLAVNLFGNLRKQLLTSGFNIRSIHISKNGIIWIGSDAKGLTKYNPETSEVKYYKANPKLKTH